MKKTGIVVVSLVAMVLLGGCGETKRILGQTKTPPDEFAVYSRAPLSLPPDYGLRPPVPGSQRQQKIEPRNQAKRVVLGTTARDLAGRTKPAGVPTASVGVQSLLKEAGALNADPNIRALVDTETTFLAAEDLSFTERLMFWGVATQYGTIVDAPEESKRIRENQALGRPITEGETPTIKRKRRALLEGIFD